MSELTRLIEYMIAQSASDLHVGALRSPAFRISGELIFDQSSPSSHEDVLKMLQEMVSKESYQSFLDSKELDFAYEYNNARLRGNAYVQKNGASFVLRLVPEVKTLQELNLPPILEQFALARQGFFLVVGPVGQGKTTTLSAMIDIVNKNRAAHIITIEDPIEHIHNPVKSIIDQREVGVETNSFESALKSAFREDVNVILIGEMRTRETMATAVTAAETGHLVFSTLHTNTASQTIDRIIDSFPPEQQDQIRIQLSSSLLGIFSQRLVPRSSGGRIVAFELLVNTPAVANLIREKRTHEIDVMIETGSEQGMVDINRSLVELVRSGEITREVAYQYSTNQRALATLI